MMFKKNYLKYATLMGISLLASTCIQASELEGDDPMDVDVGQTTPITQLPNEALDHIFSYLSPEDAARVRSVCKSWCGILENRHGEAFSHSNALFDPIPSTGTSSIPDDEMAKTLSFHINQSGFAPLEHVFISPDLYPKATRLLKAADLEADPSVTPSWYATLFGEAAPQNVRSAGLVMGALPRILVRKDMGHNTLQAMTPYVQTLANHTRFKVFTGQEGAEDLKALKAPPTPWLRAHRIYKHINLASGLF
ncbi:MAG: F-box protein [Proteobacteria bacterium]|nr:F-box protein [Pseudomonadota bacterium]